MLRAAARRTHAGWQEIAALTLLYGVYELLRGVGSVNLASATEHAQRVVRLEGHLGVYSERTVQHFSEGIPMLSHTLATLYIALHVAGTIGVLFWVYRSRRFAFPFVRTALVLTTALALPVYALYPVAPPRLAIAGFADTVSESGPLDLSSTLLGRFYNPVAAVPSLHLAYALLVGAVIVWLARPLTLRVAGALYPFVALFVIVATGNHYYFDAATGAAVAAVAALAARGLTREPDGSRRAPPPRGERPSQPAYRPGSAPIADGRSAGNSSNWTWIGTSTTGIELAARTSRTTAARPWSSCCDQPSATMSTDASRATRSTCSPGTPSSGSTEPLKGR
jgi:hypothetical protein